MPTKNLLSLHEAMAIALLSHPQRTLSFEAITTFIEDRKLFENRGKKSQVISFLLSNIPQLDDSTSWEQILDFRKDNDVLNKYYALLKWINEIANSNYSIVEIKENYEYLYSEYVKYLKYHKIKYNTKILEVLIPAGASLLLGQPFSGLKLASDFLKMKLLSVSLLEEEGKLPGKEIAYIYKTKEKFK